MGFLKKLYVTYVKTNPETGTKYSGLSGGVDEGNYSVEELSREILDKRDSSHHKNEDGYYSAEIDRYSYDYAAMRGREQQLIDCHGGAQSQGGTSGNAINGISERNKKREIYLDAAKKLFGILSIFFLLFTLYHLL